MVLGTLFFFLNNADFWFNIKEFTWKSYIAAETLFITTQTKLINKKKLAKAALNENSKTFMVYVAALEVSTTMPIHLSKAFKIQDNLFLIVLWWDKAPTKIPAEYSDYADFFFFNLAMELPENTSINKYVIKLVEGK